MSGERLIFGSGLPKPSPFAYPGRTPGFDPTHPAARGLTAGLGFSAVAVAGQGNFTSLLSGKPFVLNSTPGTTLKGLIGPAITFSSTQCCEVPETLVTSVPTAATWAWIFQLTSSSVGNQNFITAQASAGNIGPYITSNAITLWCGTANAASGLTLTVGHSYFCAVSAAGGTVTFLVCDLSTGSIRTSTASGTLSTYWASTYWGIGNGNTGFNAALSCGAMAAAMAVRQSLSLPQMLEFAADPWAFWYPNKTPLIVNYPTPNNSRGALVKLPKTSSPFAYPGRSPGFDPTHPVLSGRAGNIVFSAVARNDAHMQSIISSKASTTIGTPGKSILGGIGPSFQAPSAGNGCGFANQPAVISSTFTIAGIFQLTTLATFNIFFGSSGSLNTGCYLGCGTGSGANGQVSVGFYNGTNFTAPTAVMAVNTPYFVAASVKNTGSTNYAVDFILLNLATGQIKTASTTGTSAVNAASDGTYVIGGLNSGIALPMQGYCAAVAFVNSGLTIPELVAFAADPWSFWYPHNTPLLFKAPPSINKNVRQAIVTGYSQPIYINETAPRQSITSGPVYINEFPQQSFVAAIFDRGRALLSKFNVFDTRPKDNESGLVGWWTFDDGTATDFSGNGSNGTLGGILPTPIDGIIGGALNFNYGTPFNSNVSISSLQNIGTTNTATISLWLQSTATQGAYNALLETRVPASGGVGLFVSGGSTTNLAFIWLNTTAEFNGTFGFTFTNGIWYHAAVVVTPTAWMLYKNGLLVGTRTQTNTVQNLSGLWEIGNDPAVNTRRWAGNIDDVRIYNRSLGPDEIFSLYAQGASYGQGQPEGELPSLLIQFSAAIFDRGRALLRKFNVFDTRPLDNESGLVGWWTFDDGTATDFSGNQNNGTLSGTTHPVIADGIIGSALSFANSGYVDCGTAASLNPPQITVSAWVNFTALTNSYTAIVCKETPVNFLYTLYVKSTGKLALYVGDGTSFNYDGTGTNTLVTGVWYHLAFTVSSSASIGYVNGLKDGSTTGLTWGSGSIVGHTTIGQDLVNSGRLMNGRIDDVRIYSRALSASEIFSIYAQGISYGQGQPEGELPTLFTTTSTTTIALLARAFAAATARAAATGVVTLAAIVNEMASGLASASGIVPLLARATEMTAARTAMFVGILLQARNAAMAKGRAAVSGAAALSSRITEMATGRSFATGKVTLSAIGKSMASGNGNLAFGAIVALLGRLYSMATERSAISGVVPLYYGSWSGPTNGLIHRWPLDLTHFVGGADQDVVGSISITESGTITSTAGPSGASNAARLFDGSTGYGAIASSPLPSSGAYTVSFWGLNNNPSVSGLAPTALNLGTNSGGNTIRMANENGSGLGTAGEFEWNAGSGAFATTATVFSSSAWAQVAITFDGTSTFQTIVNGSVVSTATDNMGAALVDDTLGARSSSAAFWNGAISQLAIYNRVLSTSELSQLYNADAPGSSSSGRGGGGGFMASGRAGISGVTALSSRITEMATGLASTTGKTVLTAIGKAMANGRSSIAFGSIIALLGMLTSMAKERTAISGKAAIQASIEEMASGRAAPAGKLTLTAPGTGMANARAGFSGTANIAARSASIVRGSAGIFTSLLLAARGNALATARSVTKLAVSLQAIGAGMATSRVPAPTGILKLAAISKQMATSTSTLFSYLPLIALSAAGSAMASSRSLLQAINPAFSRFVSGIAKFGVSGSGTAINITGIGGAKNINGSGGPDDVSGSTV